MPPPLDDDGRSGATLAEAAPAKINLTLRVHGKRTDGYHELDSLVAFARYGDRLRLRPGPRLDLRVIGPTAGEAGDVAHNLVLRAARALRERVGELTVGRFVLTKRLPAGAGLGGGSADAGAALRLLARVNGIALNDARIMEAAKATGADVPVCLDPRPRLMRGVGDRLSEPLALPSLPALLVHPGIGLATKEVFAAFSRLAGAESAAPDCGSGGNAPNRCLELAAPSPSPTAAKREKERLIERLARERNDLEPAAIELAPVVAEVIARLHSLPGCRLARMSGSGSACFGLFESARAAARAGRILSAAHPRWWVRATALGGDAAAARAVSAAGAGHA